MNLTREIIATALRSNCGSVLIEGFTPKDYQEHVETLKKYVAGLEGTSIDFIKVFDRDQMELSQSLSDVETLFVYNFDLFGEGIDPEIATNIMGVLRGRKAMSDGMRQLMIARPNANLDYNSRQGFTYHDNHPLGNWCEFWNIENEGLVEHYNPIKRR